MNAYSFFKEKCLASVAAMVIVAAPQAAFAAPDGLVTHRAIYDLRVAESRGATGITSGDGRLVYEFKRDQCGGYTSVYRQVMSLKAAEGNPTTIDFRSTAFENDAEDFFRFENKNIINGTEDSAIQGEAQRNEKGLAVTLTKPSAQNITLDNAALFPTQHMKQVLKSAREGKNLFEAPIFDGSGKADSAGDTLTLIGKGITDTPDDLEQVARDAKLENIRHWPITISYFDKTAAVTEQTPKFVFKADIYENGITRNLNLNYGTFSVQAKLVGLELLPDQPEGQCEKP